MKIKDKLRLNAIFSLLTVLIITAALFFLTSEIQSNVKITRLFSDLRRKSFQLNVLSYQYLLHPHERVSRQWQAVHASLGDIINRIQPEFQQQEFVSISENHTRLRRLFQQLQEVENTPMSDPVSRELRERIASQLTVSLSSVVSDTSSLMDQTYAHLTNSQQRIGVITIAVIVLLSSFKSLFLLSLSGSLAKSIYQLHAGTRRVAEGNIQHRIVMTGEDEIAELADSFNEMTEKLQKSYEALTAKIEELHRKEEELKVYNTKLEWSNSELEAFSYSVSHDLRTPLRSLAGFSDVLLEDYDERLDAEGRDYLKRIKAAATRMGILIDDLLRLSRVGRMEIIRTRVDLSEIVKQIADTLRQQEPERLVVFHIQPDVLAEADRQLVRIALENILGNSWKYTGRRPKAVIEFGMNHQNGRDIYFVRDNGAGFDMNYVDKVFVPFQRLHSERDFAGTGIGLALVQRIFHRHGGHVWAESAVNQGTTIYFSFSS